MNDLGLDALPSGAPEQPNSKQEDSKLNSPAFVVAAEPTTRLERFFSGGSEWFSSILVKETRQALKSRQFLWTFFMLMAIVLVWSFFALALREGRTNELRSDIGPLMLNGFIMIVGLPLCIIIPFTTFRSLAQEYEDGTIQMILITTMKPYQIIAGKLGSALLQMLVYLSVLAPCICFCYLLRGVDIQQIVFCLCAIVIISLGLCCLALALGSMTTSRIFSQIMSGLFVMGAAFAYWMWCIFINQYIFYAGNMVFSNDSNTTWIMTIGLGTLWLSSAMLLFAGATAQITFLSNNRSTLLRILMFVQQFLYLGWVLAIFCTFGTDKYGVFASAMFAFHYWLIMGAMMMASHSQLSNRVRRGLPKSVIGRTFGSLFMPGPGRGYLFALANGFFVLVWLTTIFFGHQIFVRDFGINVGFSGNTGPTSINIELGIMGLCAGFIYFAMFLSASFLLSRWLATKNKGPFVFANLVLLVAVVFLTTMVGLLFSDDFFGYSNNYEVSHALNWYYTSGEITDRGLTSATSGALLIASIVTIPLTLFAIFIASKELQATPDATPERVLEQQELERLEREVPPDDETIDEIFADKPMQNPDSPSE